MNVRRTDDLVVWFNGLRDLKARAAIQKRIDKVELDGHFGDNEPVGEGVREMRVHVGPGYRVYYYTEGNVTCVLLCGGTKHRQQADIDAAIALARKLRE